MFWKPFFAAAFFTFLVSVLGFQCPPESERFQNGKCYKFHPEPSPAVTAKLSCSVLGGYLASIPNEEVNSFLSQKSAKHFGIGNENDAWIWGELPDNSTKWKWSDESDFEYANFEIAKFSPEHHSFLSLNYKTQKWDAYPAPEQLRKPYICEYGDATTTSTSSPSSTASKPKECPESWTSNNVTGFCYKLFTTKTTWQDAESKCVEEGAHLISIHSEDEAEIVNDISNSNREWTGQPWTGLYTDNPNFNALDQWKMVNGVMQRLDNPNPFNYWKWSDATPVDFLPWGRDEPNHEGWEKCGLVWGTKSSGVEFNNVNCERTQDYICKKLPQ